jgi:hypothetical protein
MARVLWVGDGFQELSEPVYASAVFGRTSPLAAEAARVFLGPFDRFEPFVNEDVLPAVAEVVEIRERPSLPASRLEVLRQWNLPTLRNWMIG